jgi:hypothetical protein
MRARKDARSGEAPGWRFQMSGDVNSGDGINGVCMTDHSIFMPTAKPRNIKDIQLVMDDQKSVRN